MELHCKSSAKRAIKIFLLNILEFIDPSFAIAPSRTLLPFPYWYLVKKKITSGRHEVFYRRVRKFLSFFFFLFFFLITFLRSGYGQ